MARSKILRPLPLASLLMVGTPALAGEIDIPAGVQFDHKDWTLSCDNTRTCRAAGYQAEDYDSERLDLPVSILLTRKAGPGETVSGQLTLDPGEGSDMPETVSLHIDGRDVGALRLSRSDANADLSTQQVEALLSALKRDTRIEVTEAGGANRWRLSDQGASAVLLKMDEVQGRVGTPGALAGKRKPNRPESDALPAYAPPVVRIPAMPATTAADRGLATDAGLLQALRSTPLPKDDSCDDLASGDGDAPELVIERLSDDKLLVSTRCWMAAYNAGVGYWVVNDASPWNPTVVTTDGSDYDKGRISSGQKGRGIGDCWWTAEWAWDGERFMKTKEATSGLCRGFGGGAWQMPTWVSEVKG